MSSWRYRSWEALYLVEEVGDPQYAPLDRLSSSADAYLDLAASAVDAAEYFRDQTDREVDELFWS